MAITQYRILSRNAGEPASVVIELSFDGEGYCLGLDENGERLWRKTDTWAVNVPEGVDEEGCIHEAIARWEAESHKPHAQVAEAEPYIVTAEQKAAALERYNAAQAQAREGEQAETEAV